MDAKYLITTQTHLNRLVSTDHINYITADKKDFYDGTPLIRYEYLCTNIKNTPDETVQQYQLQIIAKNG